MVAVQKCNVLPSHLPVGAEFFLLPEFLVLNKGGSQGKVLYSHWPDYESNNCTKYQFMIPAKRVAFWGTCRVMKYSQTTFAFWVKIQNL